MRALITRSWIALPILAAILLFSSTAHATRMGTFDFDWNGGSAANYSAMSVDIFIGGDVYGSNPDAKPFENLIIDADDEGSIFSISSGVEFDLAVACLTNGSDERIRGHMEGYPSGGGAGTSAWESDVFGSVPGVDLQGYQITSLDLEVVEAWFNPSGSWTDNKVSLSLHFEAIPDTYNVSIDIKPGSDPNSINLSSHGNIPVAIYSTDTFDATTVDPATILLADAGVKTRGKSGKFKSSFEDVNDDGLNDLLVHIDTESLVLSNDDVEALLTGETFDGISISGSDTIRLVGRSLDDYGTTIWGGLSVTAIPEPSTAILLTMAAFGLLFFRQR